MLDERPRSARSQSMRGGRLATGGTSDRRKGSIRRRSAGPDNPRALEGPIEQYFRSNRRVDPADREPRVEGKPETAPSAASSVLPRFEDSRVRLAGPRMQRSRVDGGNTPRRCGRVWGAENQARGDKARSSCLGYMEARDGEASSNEQEVRADCDASAVAAGVGVGRRKRTDPRRACQSAVWRVGRDQSQGAGGEEC